MVDCWDGLPILSVSLSLTLTRLWSKGDFGSAVVFFLTNRLSPQSRLCLDTNKKRVRLLSFGRGTLGWLHCCVSLIVVAVGVGGMLSAFRRHKSIKGSPLSPLHYLASSFGRNIWSLTGGLQKGKGVSF